MGGAVLFATSLALLARSSRASERGTAFGVWGATIRLRRRLGPLVGGVLTDGLGWEWIFLVNVPIGAAAHRFDPRPRARVQRPRRAIESTCRA